MFQRCRYGEHFQAHGGHSSEVRERNESSQTLVRRFAQISLAFLPLVHFFFLVWGCHQSTFIEQGSKINIIE